MKSGGGQQFDGTLEIGALFGGDRRVKHFGFREMTEYPCNSTTGEAPMRAASAGSSSSETPRRDMPVSTLRCTGTLRWRPSGRQRVEGFYVFDGGDGRGETVAY